MLYISYRSQSINNNFARLEGSKEEELSAVMFLISIMMRK